MPSLDPSTILAIISIAITLIIGVVSISISRRTISKQTLLYTLSQTQLIEAETTGLQIHTITVDGQCAESLVKTTVRFVNIGNSKIEPSDFSETMPLRIIAANRIFFPEDGYLIEAKDPKSIKLNMVDEKTMGINCAYIKPGKASAFTIEILHDGPLSVSGELKSGEVKTDNTLHRLNIFSNIAMVFDLFFGWLAIGFLCCKILFFPKSSLDVEAINSYAIAILLLLFLELLYAIFLTKELQAQGIITIKNTHKKRKKNRVHPDQ